MKARIQSHCLPKRKNSGFQCVEVFIHVDLPFVPAAGTMVKLTPEGEFLCVDQVYWSAVEPDVIIVFLEEPEVLPTFAFLRKEGWVEHGGTVPSGGAQDRAAAMKARSSAPERMRS